MSDAGDTISSWVHAGASVRGPAHAQAERPNQDAWLVRCRAREVIAVVSDGLGSKPMSEFGAQMACKAASQAVSAWRCNSNATPQSLIRIVHAIWSARVAPHKESDCAATCLLAYSNEKRTILAQLGDGLIAFGSAATGIEVLPSQVRDFSSETTGLGICSDLKEWRVSSVDRRESTFSILLASDGVSEDLLPDKLPDFIGFCSERYLSETPRRRAGLIAQDLRDWPTPGHADDKTLVLLRRIGNIEKGDD